MNRVTIITMFKNFSWNERLWTHVRKFFAIWQQQGNIGKLHVKVKSELLSRRNDQGSSSSPRKRFSSVTTKHTRRAREKLKKFLVMHSLHCSWTLSFRFSPHSSWKFKLKIIHSRHHMWDLSVVENVNRSTLQSLFPTLHITISDVRNYEQAAISAVLHLIAMGNKPLGRCFSEVKAGLKGGKTFLIVLFQFIREHAWITFVIIN